MDTKKIAQAAQLIADAKHAVALTGAGISTPSGIPDFRSEESGLWEQADPMTVASIWGFMEYPQGFYDWVKPLARLILTAKPNPAHLALADMESQGKMHAIITQNIDNLHQRAGSKRVLEVHGHLREATCIRCYHLMPGQPMIEQFVADGQVPRCPECGGVMKPNVVLFGEMLPVGVMYEAETESKKCDLMLVAGSSLQVAPAADLPLLAKEHNAKLIIVNKSPTPLDGDSLMVIREDVSVAIPKIFEMLNSS
jgi:NAD-dependent protein deacetylase/lipoamidase